MVPAAQRPRRRLLVGRLLPVALATVALLHVLALLGKGVHADVFQSPLEKLAGIRQVMEKPRLHGIEDSMDLLPGWYTTWRLVLQNQIDGLFSALEQRAAEQTERIDVHERSSPRLEIRDGMGFKIAMVGDSTIRMQAKILSWILSQRVTTGGEKQCFDASVKDDVNLVDVRCTGADVGVGAEGRPLDGGSYALSLTYTKVFNSCVSDKTDGDFVYFGCGLHFLQLIPEREINRGPLDMWVHYERMLEEAVLFYRSGAGSDQNRVPMGEAFMMTHSFAVERLKDDYATRVREYAEGNETVLATCREEVGKVGRMHRHWPYEYEPEEICTLGSFDDRGVVELNRRAEAVLARLGVPAVLAYDITQGQTWASPPMDGRHYPPMVPQELNSFLSEVSMALRRERREGTRRAEGVRFERGGSTRSNKLWLLLSLVLCLATVGTTAAVVHYIVSFVKRRRTALAL